ncbi:MAG: polysaccharide deacetylase family protein [Jiangellales bacterium]
MVARAGVVVLLTAVVLIGGCSSGDDPAAPSPTATEDEMGESPEPVSLPRFVIVPPSLIEGLDTRVEEDFGPGRLTFATVPEVPGAEGFADEIQMVVDADIERFRADTVPVDAAPFPELLVRWDLVAASPQALGARVLTTELNATGDDGRVTTAWYDVAAGTSVSSEALLADGAIDELEARVREAGEADPRVDRDLLADEIAADDQVFDALGFSADGRLLVEFDQGTVADDLSGPIVLAVDPESLLSEFGTAAQSAAVAPSDPGLTPPEPTPTPEPSAVTPPPDTAAVDCQVQQCVALTFDDGPVAGTADLLDTLAAKGVRATFFVVGSNAAAQPDLLARMVAEGHAVGNHTEDHPDLSKLDAAAVRAEIEQVNDIVEGATGQRPVLLRPPYGATNDTVGGVAAELGMAQILWNVDPEDWKDRDSAIVQQRVLATTGPGDIVLSHDIHETTRDAYPAIIDQLQAEGYVLVTVPELLGTALQPGQRFSSQ